MCANSPLNSCKSGVWMKVSGTSSGGLAVAIFVNSSTDSDILQVSVFDVMSIFANSSTDPDIWQF